VAAGGGKLVVGCVAALKRWVGALAVVNMNERRDGGFGDTAGCAVVCISFPACTHTVKLTLSRFLRCM